MSNIEITERKDSKPKDHNPESGDWYIDETSDSIYVVAELANTYTLINISSGCYYEFPHQDINQVFGWDAKDFRKIENVDITI